MSPILGVKLIIAAATLSFSVSAGIDTVTLCACPQAPCAGKCRDYKIGECQQFDQCFDRFNGIFGYVIPELLSDDEVVVNVYSNKDCTLVQFDPSVNGWQGYCSSKCWGTISNIGSGGCSSAAPSRAGIQNETLLWSLLFVAAGALLSFLE